MAAPTPSPRARKAGALLMWFAVLGGALAWTVHLFVAWGVDELTCRSGHTHVGSVPVRAVVAAGVVVPALVTAAATWTAWLAWRRLSRERTGDDPRRERADLLAVLGLCADALFLLIILAGGAALLVFPPCQ